MAQTKTNTSRKSKIENVTKTIVGLSECDHFLNWNDCSSVTYGILAPLLRKIFSDNTLTDVFDHFEKQKNKNFATEDLIEYLIRRRNKLPKNDISLSRRSLINRLIFHIGQVKFFDFLFFSFFFFKNPNEVHQNIGVYRFQLKQRMINENEVSTVEKKTNFFLRFDSSWYHLEFFSIRNRFTKTTKNHRGQSTFSCNMARNTERSTYFDVDRSVIQIFKCFSLTLFVFFQNDVLIEKLNEVGRKYSHNWKVM